MVSLDEETQREREREIGGSGVKKHRDVFLFWHLEADGPDGVTSGAQTQTAQRKMEVNVEYLLASAANLPQR